MFNKYKNINSFGLSLMEIMISISLLSLILLGIITVFPAGIESIKIAKNISAACNIAGKHIEQYKSNFYLVPDVSLLGNIELDCNSCPSVDPPVTIQGTVFLPTVMVKPVKFNNKPVDPNEVVEVSVTVKWKQPSGMKQVKLNSYIYNKSYLPSNVPMY